MTVAVGIGYVGPGLGGTAVAVAATLVGFGCAFGVGVGLGGTEVAVGGALVAVAVGTGVLVGIGVIVGVLVGGPGGGGIVVGT